MKRGEDHVTGQPATELGRGRQPTKTVRKRNHQLQFVGRGIHGKSDGTSGLCVAVEGRENESCGSA
jgi:hypothetical protein